VKNWCSKSLQPKTEFVSDRKLRVASTSRKIMASCITAKRDEFLIKKLNLVISKNNSVGIPQGSPISATLANIYMLEFDQEIFDGASSIGGFYQRYSDDLIIICEQRFEDDIIKLIRERIDTRC
jgi:hypothetical protein